MVDTTQANTGLWRPGQERHISISHLLRAFSRTDPAPNRVNAHQHCHPPRTHVNAPTQKFSEEHWFAICQLAAMGFYYHLRPGKYAKSHSNTKDHHTLGKPFRLRHASFLLNNGKHHAAHLLTPCCKRRCNDFELSTMYMAMLSFDDQKRAAKGDRVCQQYIGGALCPGKALYDRVYSLIGHVGKKTMHPKGINAPLYSYFVPATAKKKASWANVTTSQLTAALRLATDLCKARTGIPPNSPMLACFAQGEPPLSSVPAWAKMSPKSLVTGALTPWMSSFVPAPKPLPLVSPKRCSTQVATSLPKNKKLF